MKQMRLFLFLIMTIFAASALAQDTKSAPATSSPQPRSSAATHVVDLKTPDGIVLKASYFPSAIPGPGVLLFHQSNRDRKSWDGVAEQLAAAGINVLTIDNRGHGESGGKDDKWRPEDIDAAFECLISQPDVNRDVIGAGGAGVLGVEDAVETARRHSAQVKSLALLSGETSQEGLPFLHKASWLPGLFVASDDDEYPPIREAMELLYVTSSSPSKRWVHYSAAHDAPWLWYEPFDIGKVPANGAHGTDLFEKHSELPGIIVDWFVTTLIKTPGHAPVDGIASAAILNQVRMPGGVAQVRQQLIEARKNDPQVQLWPEITMTTIGEDHLRAGEPKEAVEIFELNLLAYSDSADVESNLADGYLELGQKDLARQHAEKALAILNAHSGPASSWTDTEQYRGEIRRDAEDILRKLAAKQQ
jgi:pimeloyl-ACP methyl ester carboxylesterase